MHAFTPPSPLDEHDPATVRLVRWLAIVHACYLFSFEYFTEIETMFALTDSERMFFEKMIFNGMAEFRHVNRIPITTTTNLVGRPEAREVEGPTRTRLSGRLLLNGGGKDGLVSASLLDDSEMSFELFQVGTSAAQASTAKVLHKQPIVFRRHLDSRWMHEGKYQGHRPTSAAIAITAILTAYSAGYKDVIASNESSSNETTLHVDDVSVNHQYTKSYEFEQDISNLLAQHHVPVRYFSLLRPLHELQIVELLHQRPYLHESFVSCNHGFRRGVWCLTCAKCAFIALITTAVSPDLAERALKTERPIALAALHPHIATLVDPALEKPLECVGTLNECQVAAKLILQQHAELLPDSLRELFARTTAHITQPEIDRLRTELNSTHGIPQNEYRSVLEALAQRTSLR